MAEEIIANFKLEEQQETTATFAMQENNINATFNIQRTTEDKYFVFEQAISIDTWIVYHGLNKKPSVTVVDEYDRVVTPDIQYIDNDNLIIRFNFAFKGKAYLN